MQLHELSAHHVRRRPKKRLGMGTGSGQGKTAGRGTKGQLARGRGKFWAGFEGGQTPLIRRFPKRGFTNGRFQEPRPEVVNVGALNRFAAGAVVGPEALHEAGLLRRRTGRVKVLGDGALTRRLTVRAHAVSTGARAKIEQAGGVVEVVPVGRAQGTGERAVGRR